MNVFKNYTQLVKEMQQILNMGDRNALGELKGVSKNK
jgi:hypothetical protein